MCIRDRLQSAAVQHNKKNNARCKNDRFIINYLDFDKHDFNDMMNDDNLDLSPGQDGYEIHRANRQPKAKPKVAYDPKIHAHAYT